MAGRPPWSATGHTGFRTWRKEGTHALVDPRGDPRPVAARIHRQHRWRGDPPASHPRGHRAARAAPQRTLDGSLGRPGRLPGQASESAPRTEVTMSHIEHSVEVKVPVRTAYDQWTQFE